MADTPTLRLTLEDVHGKRLTERVDIRLRHQALAEQKLIKGADASRRIRIVGLRGSPMGVYRLDVDPRSFLPMSQFVNVEAQGTTDVRACLAIDPDKVVRVEFPAYDRLPDTGRTLLRASPNVLGFEGQTGADLYEALDDLRRAALLNILAKTGATVFGGGRAVLSYFGELREIRGDRFFVRVPKVLREDTTNSVATGLFRAVDGSLHHPPADFSVAGSFKTDDRYANLQLTFFVRDGDWVADVDIDDAAGLIHVFQVLRNALTGRPTHPYDIHQLLVRHQKLDPGYRLTV